MAGSISNSNPSRLGGGLPGGQPKGGLLGGGGGTSGGSGMVGGSERGRDRKLLRKAFGRFSVIDGGLDNDDGMEGKALWGGAADLPAELGGDGMVSGTIINDDFVDEDGDGFQDATKTTSMKGVYKLPITPFRQAFNAGDSAGTINNSVLGYLNAPNQVGGTGAGQLIYGRAGGIHKGGLAAYTGNPKYVYDSSDYIRFKKLQAKNRTYNDKSFGGANNGAYVPLMRVRRGF